LPSVLLLNADAQPLSYMPLSTISWQSAVKTIFQEKAKVLASYENRLLRSSSFSMPMPSVILLHAYHKHPSKAKFTRRNLFIRDEFKCQYCGDRFNYGDLTIDHVIPKSRGGKLSWENSVAACMPCNVAKGKRIVNPMKKPHKPTWFEINNAARNYKLTIPDPAWQMYIQWPEELLTINPLPQHA